MTEITEHKVCNMPDNLQVGVSISSVIAESVGIPTAYFAGKLASVLP
jgi:hypothetical protein